MKDFKDFGLKRRFFPKHNYNAIWCNLKTIRLGEGKALPLPPSECEFYDVGINTRCNAECPFCYVSASGKGIDYPNICETWEKWMNTFWERNENGIIVTNKPFQIAIGSTGEPTLHPQVVEIAKMVKEAGFFSKIFTNYDFPEVVKQLDGIIDIIRISYYGPMQLPNQKDFKSKITLKIMLTKETFPTLQSLIDFEYNKYDNSKNRKT